MDKIVRILMQADAGNVGQVFEQVNQKIKTTAESLKQNSQQQTGSTNLSQINAALQQTEKLIAQQNAAATSASKQSAASQVGEYQAQLQKKVAASAAATQQIKALNANANIQEVPASVPSSFARLKGTIGQVAAGFAMAQAAIFAVTAAIQTAVNAVRGFIGVNSQMEQLRLQFEVMLGSKEKMVELFAITKQFADTTPFNDLESYRAGQALIAAGVKDAKEYAVSLRTVGDLAAASGRSISEVASAYARLRSGATGEAMEALRLMNISRAMFEAKGIRFDSGGQALATSEKLVKTLDSIVGDKYGGLTEKLSKTWSGLWSTFTSGAENSVRTLSGGTFELLKSALASVNAAMDAALKDPDQKLKRLGDAVTVAATAVSELAGSFNGLVGTTATSGLQALGEALAAIGFGLSTLIYLTRMAQAAMQLLWDTVSMNGNAKQNFVTTMKKITDSYNSQFKLVKNVYGMKQEEDEKSAESAIDAVKREEKARDDAAQKAIAATKQTVSDLNTIMKVQESVWAVEKAKGRDAVQIAEAEMEQRKYNLAAIQEKESAEKAAIEANRGTYQKSTELLAAEAEYAKALSAYYDALIDKKDKLGQFMTNTSKLMAEADAIDAKGGDAGVKRYEALKTAVSEYLDGLQKLRESQMQTASNAAKMEAAVNAAQTGNLSQYQNQTAVIAQSEKIFQISALQERLSQIQQLSQAQNLGSRERFTLYEQERQVFTQMTGGISAAISETMQQIETLQNKALGAASSAIGILEKVGADKSTYEDVASMIRSLNLDMGQMSLQTLSQMAALADQLKSKGVNASDLMPNSGQVLAALRKELSGIPDTISNLKSGLQTLVEMAAQVGAQAANNFWAPWEAKLATLKEQLGSLAIANLAPQMNILPTMTLPQKTDEGAGKTVTVAANTQLTVQGNTLRDVDEIVAKARDRFGEDLYAALQEANTQYGL